MAYTGRHRPSGVPLSGFRYVSGKRVGNSLVEVYEKEGTSVISVCKKSHGPTDGLLMAVKKLRKGSGFVIYSYLKDSAFTAVKRRAKF